MGIHKSLLTDWSNRVWTDDPTEDELAFHRPWEKKLNPKVAKAERRTQELLEKKLLPEIKEKGEDGVDPGLEEEEDVLLLEARIEKENKALIPVKMESKTWSQPKTDGKLDEKGEENSMKAIDPYEPVITKGGGADAKCLVVSNQAIRTLAIRILCNLTGQLANHPLMVKRVKVTDSETGEKKAVGANVAAESMMDFGKFGWSWGDEKKKNRKSKKKRKIDKNKLKEHRQAYMERRQKKRQDFKKTYSERAVAYLKDEIGVGLLPEETAMVRPPNGKTVSLKEEKARVRELRRKAKKEKKKRALIEAQKQNSHEDKVLEVEGRRHVMDVGSGLDRQALKQEREREVEEKKAKQAAEKEKMRGNDKRSQANLHKNAQKFLNKEKPKTDISGFELGAVPGEEEEEAEQPNPYKEKENVWDSSDTLSSDPEDIEEAKEGLKMFAKEKKKKNSDDEDDEDDEEAGLADLGETPIAFEFSDYAIRSYVVPAMLEILGKEAHVKGEEGQEFSVHATENDEGATDFMFAKASATPGQLALMVLNNLAINYRTHPRFLRYKATHFLLPYIQSENVQLHLKRISCLVCANLASSSSQEEPWDIVHIPEVAASLADPVCRQYLAMGLCRLTSRDGFKFNSNHYSPEFLWNMMQLMHSLEIETFHYGYVSFVNFVLKASSLSALVKIDGSLEIVLNLLHSPDDAVVALALRTLEGLLKFDINRQAFMRSPVTVHYVLSLAKNPDPSVASSVSRVISELFSSGASLFKQITGDLLSALISVILLGESPKMRDAAARGIFKFLEKSPKNLDALLAMNSQAIIMFVKILSTKDRDLNTKACTVLRHLSESKETMDRIINQNGLTLLSRSILNRTVIPNLDVVWMLRNIVSRADLHDIFIEEHGVECLIRFCVEDNQMQRLMATDALQILIPLLTTITKSKPNKLLIVKALLSHLYLRKIKANMPLITKAIQCLIRLCADHQYRKHIWDVKAASRVLTIWDKLPPRVQVLGLDLIKIYTHEPAMVTELNTLQFCKRMVKLGSTPNHYDIWRVMAKQFEHFTTLEPLSVNFAEAGALKLMIAYKHANIDKATVDSATESLLQLLMSAPLMGAIRCGEFKYTNPELLEMMVTVAGNSRNPDLRERAQNMIVALAPLYTHNIRASIKDEKLRVLKMPPRTMAVDQKPGEWAEDMNVEIKKYGFLKTFKRGEKKQLAADEEHRPQVIKRRESEHLISTHAHEWEMKKSMNLMETNRKLRYGSIEPDSGRGSSRVGGESLSRIPKSPLAIRAADALANAHKDVGTTVRDKTSERRRKMSGAVQGEMERILSSDTAGKLSQSMPSIPGAKSSTKKMPRVVPWKGTSNERI